MFALPITISTAMFLFLLIEEADKEMDEVRSVGSIREFVTERKTGSCIKIY